MNPDHHLAELAEDQCGLVTLQQARSVGLTDRQLRLRVGRGQLDRVSRLVIRISGSPRTVEQMILAATWSCGPTAVASHGTAAWLWGLDGATRPTDLPHVTVLRPMAGHPHLAQVHQTIQLDDVDRGRHGAIPVTSPARTLIDLAAVVAPAQLERAVDGALRDGLTSPRFLEWRVGEMRGPGRHGSPTLAGLLGPGAADTRPVESWLESEALRVFAAAGLPRPEVQRVLRSGTGRIIRVDFTFGSGRLVAEVSGHRTHSTLRQRQSDGERRSELSLLGITVIEFTYEDVVERPHFVAERTQAHLEALGLCAVERDR